jgi:hypothetical protein
MEAIWVIVVLAFAVGVVIGVIAVISAAIRREERLYSLEGYAGSARATPPAARVLVSIGHRRFPDGGIAVRRAAF